MIRAFRPVGVNLHYDLNLPEICLEMCGSRDDEGDLILGHQGEGVGGGYRLPG